MGVQIRYKRVGAVGIHGAVNAVGSGSGSRAPRQPYPRGGKRRSGKRRRMDSGVGGFRRLAAGHDKPALLRCSVCKVESGSCRCPAGARSQARRVELGLRTDNPVAFQRGAGRIEACNASRPHQLERSRRGRERNAVGSAGLVGKVQAGGRIPDLVVAGGRIEADMPCGAVADRRATANSADNKVARCACHEKRFGLRFAPDVVL